MKQLYMNTNVWAKYSSKKIYNNTTEHIKLPLYLSIRLINISLPTKDALFDL